MIFAVRNFRLVIPSMFTMFKGFYTKTFIENRLICEHALLAHLSRQAQKVSL